MVSVKVTLVDELNGFFEDKGNDLLFNVIPTILKPDAPAFDNCLQDGDGG